MYLYLYRHFFYHIYMYAYVCIYGAWGGAVPRDEAAWLSFFARRASRSSRNRVARFRPSTPRINACASRNGFRVNKVEGLVK